MRASAEALACRAAMFWRARAETASDMMAASVSSSIVEAEAVQVVDIEFAPQEV